MSGLEGLTKEELIAIILELRERVLVLEAENAEIKSGKPGSGGTPLWVKPNRRERRAEDREDRKKRKHSFVRRREEPTEVVEHKHETCPDCGRKLTDGWVAKTRQVIEIPKTPIRIIEHRAMARYCGVCKKSYTKRIDLTS